MYGYIYETINLINNKKYIGKHKASKFDKNYYGSGIALKRALNKYGKENFKVIILEEVNTETLKGLAERETYYIKKYNAVKDKSYYNNSYGGESEGWYNINKAFKDTNNYPSKFKGHNHSEKTKQKISKSLKGRKSPMKGRHLTEEHKEKIRQKTKETLNKPEIKNKISCKVKEAYKNGKIRNRRNYSLTEEHKKKISQSLTGKFKDTYVWVNNGKERHYINKIDLETYINQGYIRGMGGVLNRN